MGVNSSCQLTGRFPLHLRIGYITNYQAIGPLHIRSGAEIAKSCIGINIVVPRQSVSRSKLQMIDERSILHETLGRNQPTGIKGWKDRPTAIKELQAALGFFPKTRRSIHSHG